MPHHPAPPDPREFTPEEEAERRDLCLSQEKTIEDVVQRGRENLWDLARALHEFDEEGGWTALGHARLDDWLAARADLGISRETYYRLVRAWRTLAVNRQVDVPTLAHLDPSKVDIARPKLESGRATVAETIEAVGSMTVRELREWVAPTSNGNGSRLNVESAPTPKPLDPTPAEPIAASGVATPDQPADDLAPPSPVHLPPDEVAAAEDDTPFPPKTSPGFSDPVEPESQPEPVQPPPTGQLSGQVRARMKAVKETLSEHSTSAGAIAAHDLVYALEQEYGLT